MKRRRAVARAARLIHLMDALRDRDYEVWELAERFHVSKRTIYNDLLIIQTEFADRVALVRRATWGVIREEKSRTE